MTDHHNQPALQRVNQLLTAAIDYLLETKTGMVSFDGIDPGIRRYQQLRQQAALRYNKRKLESLTKVLNEIIEMRRQSVDLDFDKYIQEKTGYESDIFADIRARADSITAKKKITSKGAYKDATIARALYTQTNTHQDKINQLNQMLEDAGDRFTKANAQHPAGYFTNILHTISSPDNKMKITLAESGIGPDNASTQVSLFTQEGGGSLFTAHGINLGVNTYWQDNNTVIIETKKEWVNITKWNRFTVREHAVDIKYIET